MEKLEEIMMSVPRKKKLWIEAIERLLSVCFQKIIKKCKETFIYMFKEQN